ncbi:WAT1-related protein At5g40210-like [Rhododendron vialii]|uniref:WAT1-related protein At5g40210-like n=1 Tax=Rhododendron vialii TaxID=182163 RepID=UPI00265DDD44|nr:WAT1-related protein At5g40210-like [Rhododendron vialii]
MAVECTDIGMSTIGKAAMTKGMSNFVLVVYSNALGSIILLPFVLSRSLAQMLESTGVKYSSPNLSSAMSNLIPIFTYVLAILFSILNNNFHCIYLPSISVVMKHCIVYLFYPFHLLWPSATATRYGPGLVHVSSWTPSQQLGFQG